jgi:hypothetical protein
MEFRGNEYASGSCFGEQEIQGFNRVFSLQLAKNSEDDRFLRINRGEAGGEVRSTRNSSEQFKSKLRKRRTEEIQNSQKWNCKSIKWINCGCNCECPVHRVSNPEFTNYCRVTRKRDNINVSSFLKSSIFCLPVSFRHPCMVVAWRPCKV